MAVAGAVAGAAQPIMRAAAPATSSRVRRRTDRDGMLGTIKKPS
jgi:hypothetical protein